MMRLRANDVQSGLDGRRLRLSTAARPEEVDERLVAERPRWGPRHVPEIQT